MTISECPLASHFLGYHLHSTIFFVKREANSWRHASQLQKTAMRSSQMSWWPRTDPWPSWALSFLVLTDMVVLVSWKGSEAEKVLSPSTS